MRARVFSALVARVVMSAVLALVAFTPGCGDTSIGAPLLLVDDGGYQLIVERDPFQLRLVSPEGEERLRIDPGGLGIGRVDTWSAATNYDPFFLVFDFLNGPHVPPGGFSWVAVSRVTGSGSEDGEPVFQVELTDGTAAVLRVGTPREGVFRLLLDVPGATEENEGEVGVVFTYVDLHAPAEEQYYGLGEVFRTVAHRGQQYAMQMELFDMEAMNNEAHVRIPLLVSSGSWGVFGNSMRPSYFDVAAEDPDVVRAVFNEPALDLYLMAAPEPLAITEHYVALTAQPAIPPVWAFAPIQWRNEIAGQTEVLQDASDIRAHDVPTGAIWIDRPYQTHYNSMDFDVGRYPDPAAMVETLHERGYRLAGWNAPYLHEDDPDYEMAEAAGWFAEGTFVFTSFGKFLDLTHPDCMAFWQGRVEAARQLGIEGWKLDYAEDIQIGISDARMDFTFASGEDERTMNRRYAEYYHRAYAEPLGLPEVFILARAGTIGGQAYASVIWPGDLDSDFREHGEQDAEGTTHVGGLPAAVRAGTGLSVSGYPFFASDIGGFRHNRPTHEVMVRWTEYAALLPIMQYGGGGDNHNPWDFTPDGESQFTTETLDIFRTYATLHIRLFPYFYTYSRQAHETGRPVVRPFGLAYPADGRHPDFTFLSGPDLLVAPVVESATERVVPLPAGQWIDWWTDEVVTGPADVTVIAPLDTLPLYQRAGGIVPMLRPTVRTLSPTTDPTVDSYDGDPGRIWGRVAPEVGVQNTLTLHDDAVLGVEGFEDQSLSLWAQQGTLYTGLRVQVFAPHATSVEQDGAGVAQAADLAELDTCATCWFREADSPWIWIARNADFPDQVTFSLR